MQIPQSPKKAVKTIFQDSFESIKQDLLQKGVAEAARELNFLDPDALKRRPQNELAKKDLAFAREEQQLASGRAVDDENSAGLSALIVERLAVIKEEYRAEEVKQEKKEAPMQQEFIELREKVGELSKTAGVETNLHLQGQTKKIGLLDIVLMVVTLGFLKEKVEDAKNGQDILAQRKNAKRSTGMLAWVSGDQKKIHEQGTMLIQG